jgi:predicted ArsR family transcriptional regulator
VPETNKIRTRISEFILGAAEPVTVAQIVEFTGLKSNTLRGHLDILIATGAVAREAAESTGRGRPRWLYYCAPADLSPYQILADALAVQLTAATDPSVAAAAAQRWARTLPRLATAHSPDEAVNEATQALNDLGFQATATELGDAISVTQCPYAELVADHPVICDIHGALLNQLLDQTGQDVSVDSLEVWARKGVCVARLNRPDIQAARTISLTIHSKSE